MWWVYLLVFFGGAIVGVMLMALMAGARKTTIHVYHEKDGTISILSDDPGVVVEYHHVE